VTSDTPLSNSIAGVSPECGVVNDIRFDLDPEAHTHLDISLVSSQDPKTRLDAEKRSKVATDKIEGTSQSYQAQVSGITDSLEITPNSEVHNTLVAACGTAWLMPLLSSNT